MSTKDEIRKAMRLRRRAVSPEVRAAASHDICGQLLARPDVKAAIRDREVIAVYIATPREIDLAEFIASVHAQGGRLAAPRWNGHEYEMAEFTPSPTINSETQKPRNLSLNPSSPTPNIPEPTPTPTPTPSLYLVPGLAFTREGVRLGEGGGWYDRMLSSATTSIGVAYSFQVLPTLPVEPHDCKLNDVIAYAT